MTAPTPYDNPITLRDRLIFPALRDAYWAGVEAVTAERDGYVFLLRKTEDELHASKQMHEQARTLLDQTLTERDKLREQLADAPHGPNYNGSAFFVEGQDQFVGCSCCKAGL